MTLRSAIPSVPFPAILSGRAAELMAVIRQLDQSQFWPEAQLRAAQWQQLTALLDHCCRTVPWQAERLRRIGYAPGKRLTEAAWQRLPVLTRADLQGLGDRLHATIVPPAFGPATTSASGGSSGVPVRVRKTAFESFLWEAINLREEFWHRDRPGADMMRLRGVPDGLSPDQTEAARSPTGLILPDWGHPANLIWQTGRLGIISPRVPLAAQLAFLRKLRPGYLYTFPSYLRLLLAHIRDSREKVAPMRAVFTASEQVTPELREDCRAVFNAPIVENYTSGETGYIALQCPETEALHVQAETVLVEVLDAAGHPCRPGETGRVVITVLHSFGMPILRYDIGDEAEVAPPCACGRTLPALARIAGRASDYFVMADGTRHRVDISHYRLSRITAIREFRLVQKSHDLLVLQLVLSRALTGDETAQVQAVLDRTAGHLFAQRRIEPVPALDRTPAGKLRAFVSELPGR